MSEKYDVFICHRGIDAKRNVVSVLSAMLRSKGIICFVDYRMRMGISVKSGIDDAIQSSRVFIIILSPNFASSRWCLDEVVQIMHSVKGMSDLPRKVIPVFYDVPRDLVRQQGRDTSYDLSKVKRTDAAEMESWGKALKGVCDFEGFDYDSKTTPQWEKLEEIAAEVEAFLISHNIILDQDRKMPISREPLHYDVFICHWHPDTQHNVVSVLRGMFASKGISSFVVGYGKNDAGSELNSDIVNTIRNSRVQGANTAYNLRKVKGSTEEERKRWSSALKDLSYFHGLEYNSASTFQWERLSDIVKAVEMSAKEVILCLACLEQLILDRCSSLTTLSFLPLTLRKLSLRMLESKPGSLESVNISLPKLEELAVLWCIKLKKLALETRSLRELNLGGCKGLEELDCKGLLSLKYLELDHCSSLQEFRVDASLPKLEHLSMTWCQKLKTLAIDGTSLRRMDLQGCTALEEFNFKGLLFLQNLKLDGCSSLQELRVDASLPKLEYLSMTWFQKLKTLTLDGTSLRLVDLEGCTALEELYIKGLLSLQHLKLNHCSSLHELRVDHASLPKLQDLSMICCQKLKTLALDGTSLRRVDLQGCTALKEFDFKAFVRRCKGRRSRNRKDQAIQESEMEALSGRPITSILISKTKMTTNF
ncbi:hypothetical protein KP509_10G013900 [Ceratopteris richardii]|uniref:TIR domain-containing protein n=1 Tax=Ceratopteris richardii TaxID=49495 RepID=A0A8T2TTH6_CERRI|nr:hypothetical protein KP509_10G013900 [Ceratopteris richardii]